MRLSVHVTPKSGRNEIVGWRGAELSIRVTAPPEGGKANTAACAVLSKSLGVPRSAVRVVRGETSRHKQIEIDSLDDSDVSAAFGRPDESLF